MFGAGDANADLMFVGEAPGANEDRLGLPFVGQAGKLLDKLLGEITLERGQVFIANTLKCRPPDNRDPLPREIEACQDYLRRQVDLIEPIVICTLGNFATKLLRGEGTGISRLHGIEEIRVIGTRAIRLYPLYHPAAALYASSTLAMLRADFTRIPELLALGAPPQRQTAPLSEDRGQLDQLDQLDKLDKLDQLDQLDQVNQLEALSAQAPASAAAARGGGPQRKRVADAPAPVQLGLF